MAGTMEKIKAKVEHVLHKDKTHEDPTGPHSSHTANKADPRVDSDHIGATGNHGTASHGTTGGLTGNTHSHGTTGGLTGNNTYGSDPTGPHDAHLANKADPRVDSDHIGATGNHGTHGTTGGLTGNTHSSGLTGNNHSSGLTGNNTYSHGTTGSGLTGTQYGSDATGPHDSHLANKADPRVDSSVPGPHGNTGSARTGAYGSDATGPHDSHLANKADPRVDASTTGGYGNTHSTGGYGADSNTHGHGVGGLSSGPGPAANTAGPHKNDMLNKVDPRVDSDLDGSKTYGGNKTSGI